MKTETIDRTPTNKQLTIMRCALADLIGAWEAYTHMDIHRHNWNAHAETITELTDLLKEMPKNSN